MPSILRNRLLPLVCVNVALLLATWVGSWAHVPPVAVDDYASVHSGSTVVIPVLANDYDPDGDQIVLWGFTGVQGGDVSVVGNGNEIAFTAYRSFVGEATINYKLTDIYDNHWSGQYSNEGTVTVTVWNNPPVAVDDAIDVHIGRWIDVTSIIGNDYDPDGDAISINVNPALHGYGPVWDYYGRLVYCAPEETGIDSFTYTINDYCSMSNTATVTLNIYNTPPVAIDDTIWVHAGTYTTLSTVIDNDYDPDGDGLNWGGWSEPQIGTIYFWPQSYNGPYFYYAPSDYNGIDSFTYTISDLHLTDTATLTMHIYNTPPVAADDTATADAGSSVFIPAFDNDYDIDGDPISVSAFTQGQHGSVDNNLGPFTYHPDADFTGTDTFTYTITDSLNAFATATVTVNVTAPNQPPSAIDHAYITNQDIGLWVSVADGVLAGAVDPDGGPSPLGATVVTPPQHGVLWSFYDDGSFIYYPDDHYAGEDGFTYQVFDGEAYSNVAAATITVNGPPTGEDKAYLMDAGQTLAVGAADGLLANAWDPNGDALTAVVGETVAALEVQPDGSFTFAPPAAFTGTAYFTYRLYDGRLYSGDYTVDITVNGPPTARDNWYQTPKGMPLTINAAGGVLANDIDPNGDPLTAILVGNPAHGALALNPDGSFTYTPAPGFAGADHFTYVANDGRLDSNVATVTINVTAGIEADVLPAPDGDGAVTLADWVKVGRYIAGLDPAPTGGLFQRTDCAPMATGGDGALTLTDWVQAGRYAAGLDPLQPAGGPAGP